MGSGSLAREGFKRHIVSPIEQALEFAMDELSGDAFPQPTEGQLVEDLVEHECECGASPRYSALYSGAVRWLRAKPHATRKG